jgi:glycosyltransferase involved in cell wall biosynthesis
MAHNHYRESGGEDQSFQAERELLQSHGHVVEVYIRDNHEIQESGLIQKLQLARNTTWANDSFRDMRSIIRAKKPSLAHFQNTFPLISPSAYVACKQEGIPVIQSLRNYRLLCVNALFFRDNYPCEDCLGKMIPWPGVLHACYRESHTQSAVVAGMLAYHNWLGTWKTQVDFYIVLSEFSRKKFIESGLPPEKLVVKPNFAVDRGRSSEREDYVVFVGRLAREKGLFTLLNAWRDLRNIPLIIIGTGPLYHQLYQMIETENLEKIKMLGHFANAHAIEIVKQARFLVFPTDWYETFGRVVVEAYSAGVPVVASRIGAVTELIRDGETGLQFTPGDATELSAKVEWLWNHPEESKRLGRNARREYEEKYTPERNYQMLMDIYQHALEDYA